MEKKQLKDLSLRCNMCKSFYPLPNVKEHKKHHHAMRIMRFKEGKGPHNLDSLSKRHLTLLRNVLVKFKDFRTDPNLIKRIEKINEAYEILRFEFSKNDATLRSMLTQDGKTSMRDGFFEMRDKIQEDEVDTEWVSTYKNASYPSCVYGIGRSQATNIEWRDKMEDTSAIKGNLNVPDRKNSSCYIGMFDGHHGSAASASSAQKMDAFIAEELLKLFEIRSSQMVGQPQLNGFLSTETGNGDGSTYTQLSDLEISQCISKAYGRMDQYLGHGIGEESRVRWSGCSALTCLITDDVFASSESNEKDPTDSSDSDFGSQDESYKSTQNHPVGKAYISNAGNVKSVLYHKKKPHILTHEHSLNNSAEQIRVLKAGGSINSSETHLKINGSLDSTRGLGNHGDLLLRGCIVPIPNTTVTKITADSQIMVIGTNSLWDVLNPSDVYDILLYTVPADAMTIYKSGPTPIVPVIHGNFRSGKKAESNGRHISSALPSIVETEEENGIEEVVYVHAQRSDSEDESEMEEVQTTQFGKREISVGAGYSSDSSLSMNKSGMKSYRKKATDAISCQESMSSFSAGDSTSSCASDTARTKEACAGESYAKLAALLSKQLVKAACQAGALDNISVIVVVFRGLFKE